MKTFHTLGILTTNNIHVLFFYIHEVNIKEKQPLGHFCQQAMLNLEGYAAAT